MWLDDIVQVRAYLPPSRLRQGPSNPRNIRGPQGPKGLESQRGPRWLPKVDLEMCSECQLTCACLAPQLTLVWHQRYNKRYKYWAQHEVNVPRGSGSVDKALDSQWIYAQIFFHKVLKLFDWFQRPRAKTSGSEFKRSIIKPAPAPASAGKSPPQLDNAACILEAHSRRQWLY